MATWETVRQSLSGFPETPEGTAYGTPAFRVRKRFLLRLREDDETLAIRVGQELRAALLAADGPFHTTPHYDGPTSGYVLVRLADIDDDELRDVLTDAWLVNAPARLAASWRSGTTWSGHTSAASSE